MLFLIICHPVIISAKKNNDENYLEKIEFMPY